MINKIKNETIKIPPSFEGTVENDVKGEVDVKWLPSSASLEGTNGLKSHPTRCNIISGR